MQALESSNFETFSHKIFNELQSDESLSLTLSGEETLFTRFSQAKIRQITNLQQGFVDFTFIKGNRTLSFNLPYRASEADVGIAIKKLRESRGWIDRLPEDPYLVRPAYFGKSIEENLFDLPNEEKMLNDIFEASINSDLAGVFTSGEVARASTNSKGQYHWFKTKNFYLDYSVYNQRQKAVKSTYAGSQWDALMLKSNLDESINKLNLMNIDSKKIERGAYRVYLAPSAVSELLGTLSWGGVSMGEHQRGNGSLRELWEGKKKLSPKFTLSEDFNLAMSPRFNDRGEMAPNQISLIEKGELKNFLISTRTAHEYKLESNFATDWESMRSPVINCGSISRENILQELGTGIYISDLHYLNWSDRETARLTGMTRYACFWVENGKIVCPIQDLRFDESYYKIFGDGLVDLTDFSEIIPYTGSYFQRDVGGSKVPGALISNFTFTL